MATKLLSTPRIRAVIISEAAGQRSRENIVVDMTGTAMESGTVLATTATPGVYARKAPGGTAAAVLYSYLPAATGQARAVAFVRDAELNRFELTGLEANDVAELATVGLIVRGTPGLPSNSTPAL